MAFQAWPTLRHVLFLWIFSVMPTNNGLNQTLPGCPSRCGDFVVPYPFGIGEGCYRDEGFEILCKPTNSRNTTYEPFLGISGSKIVELSLEQLRINGPNVLTCYNSTSGKRQSQRGSSRFNLDGPFTFSNTNKLVAVGCDVFSYILNSKFTSGCASICINVSVTDFVTNSSCSGVGCCESSITGGLKEFDLITDTINTLSSSWEYHSKGMFGWRENCSFAALHDGVPYDLFNGSLIEALDNTVFPDSTVKLDWAIGYGSCQDIAENETAVCARNSECVDASTGAAYSATGANSTGARYRCRCLKGYEGNPYLRDGCQDINECKNSALCTGGSVCTNTAGGYICTCGPGYARKYEKGGWNCSRLSDSRSSKIEDALIGIGVGVGALLLIAFGFWFYKKLMLRKKMKLREAFFKKNGGILLEQQISSAEGNVNKTKIFVTEELEKATDNFSESRILGKGGSGTVYKGMLTDGRIVAVKKSKIVDESQTGQFINELILLSQINHKHVVKLLGCCLETEVPLLVYEYVSNGTLSYHLHDDSRESSISWEHRLRISIEIAGALSYLHSSASVPIFHRDIKSSNILLGEGYRSTVSDFGISRSVPEEKTHLTTLVQGTFGYLDPEYFHSGQFTEKSDVYSFGVILVELLTGQRPVSFARSEEDHNLAMYFISAVKQGRLYQILETLVLNEAGKEEVFVVAKLAKRCLKLVGKKRPTMKDVLAELEGLRRYQDQTEPLFRQSYQQTKKFMDEQATLTMTGPELKTKMFVDEQANLTMTGPKSK